MMEMDAPPTPANSCEDFCSEVLTKFNNPNNERHLHICAAIGAMSQELKDKNLPCTPAAYFGASCSSLDRLLDSTVDPSADIIDSLITIMSFLIQRFNFLSVLGDKYVYLADLVRKVFKAKSVGSNAIVHGLKFASQLIMARREVVWDEIKQLYEVLCSYITDDRSQVRKQSNTCLHQVLNVFRLSPCQAVLVAPASEVIANVFEKKLLLHAGGSNGNASEGAKGAYEVLYVLDALKTCLPLMSSISSNKILRHFKSLLEVRHSAVNRRVTDSLDNFFRHNVDEVHAEVLLDLLCSLAASLSPSESSIDSMSVTARLLGTGMKTIYLLNREICVVKLPLVFNALKDVLTSAHEEALVAAVKTYVSLIETCVDESLINKGVDQISFNANTSSRKSAPTVIEKVCATVESLLDYQYEAVWDLSFEIVSAMFDKLGKHSFDFLKGTLKILADMQSLPDEDFSLRKELHECVGKTLRAMGPERFLTLLPLDLGVQDLSEVNLWLFPILKQYIVGAHLQYFTDSILPMIVHMKKNSAMLNQEGNIHSARSVDGIVYSLWSLLPSFCNYPVDTAESFNGLRKALCAALSEDPEVRGIICSSLQILIQQNKKILEEKEKNLTIEVSIPEEQAVAFYTVDVAGANLSVLRTSARELLPVLSKVYVKSSNDIGGIIQKTIGDLASVSDKKIVSQCFMNTMKSLLKVTQESVNLGNSKSSNTMEVDSSMNTGSPSITRAQLLDLAISYLPGLNSEEIDVLFDAVKIEFQSADGLIQKKAYRVLSLILQFSDEFISRKLEEVRYLVIESLPTCHFSAKRYRLDCIYFLIIFISKEGPQDIGDLLTEVILALKEANKKTRNRAYDILVQIGHVYGDEEKGGNKGKLLQFFDMVAKRLAGETPHMISAAMTGLARLAYEFSDLLLAAYGILPGTYILLQRKNKEIIKANLGLLKVLVAKSYGEGLLTHLKSVVEGVLNLQDNTRNHFKAKVKLLLEMLVKKCGLEAVKSVMPEEHMKLLTNIRKLAERKEKKHAAKSIESGSVLSKATTTRMSRWNHTKIFSDIDDDAATRTSHGEIFDRKSISSQHGKSVSQSKKKRNLAKSLQEELFEQLNDEPLDLLDSQKMRSALRSSELKRKKPDDSDEELDIDSEGRLVIHEDRRNRKSKQDVDFTSDEGDRKSHALSRSSKKNEKRRKTESGWAYTGKEYKSKKASGDVTRKDKLEPYAYWPLDRKMVSKRPEHRAAARKGMASVVKLTKKMEGKSVANALSLKKAVFKRGRKQGRK